VLVAVVAHAGDGNTHPLVVFDPADPDATARAQTAYDAIMKLAISLDGTITGEHGVGRMKQPWLRDYLGPEVHALNQRIKDALDPQGILNPGAGISDATSCHSRRRARSARVRRRGSSLARSSSWMSEGRRLCVSRHPRTCAATSSNGRRFAVRPPSSRIGSPARSAGGRWSGLLVGEGEVGIDGVPG
jgi:hypothetical protein